MKIIFVPRDFESFLKEFAEDDYILSSANNKCLSTLIDLNNLKIYYDGLKEDQLTDFLKRNIHNSSKTKFKYQPSSEILNEIRKDKGVFKIFIFDDKDLKRIVPVKCYIFNTI